MMKTPKPKGRSRPSKRRQAATKSKSPPKAGAKTKPGASGAILLLSVYRENTYTAATIQVAQGQRVISTGPYAVVRHPMYASGLLYVIGTPLALGSYVGLLAVAFMLPFLIWRLLDEERVLAQELQGYVDYQARVRYRLIPFVW
jgi:protein-S-isoprenylcysteine O-methyltransferase Ste14